MKITHRMPERTATGEKKALIDTFKSEINFTTVPSFGKTHTC